MELRHLKYFAAVAEQLSFTKAAEILNISQPPLSRQIQELEEEIGTALFVRAANRIYLTKAGEFFYDEARKILQTVTEAAQMTKVVGEVGAESLRVGCVSFLVHTILPPFLQCIRASFPSLHLDIRVMSTEAQERALRTGSLDVGFVRSWVHDEGLLFEPLVHERLTIIYPKSATSGNDIEEVLKALAPRPFVAISKRIAPGLSDRLLQICRDRGVEPVVGFESNDAYSIVAMVSAGLGWSIVPDLTIKTPDLENLGQVELPETIMLGLCRLNEPPKPPLQDFLKVAAQYFGQASPLGSFSGAFLSNAPRE
ncbi:MAG TPA: LysR family transcriptional regulator [Rectinemataceae bacterium]|nr:LysR family transcriptional regulator [Rectinemataceae bacterium]